MNIQNMIDLIIKNLEVNKDFINNNEILLFMEKIHEANRIFISGAGRSGLAIKSFANRLLHLGYDISIIGEITVPVATSKDLLILASNSGETASLMALSERAREINMQSVLITSNNLSSIAKLTNLIINIPLSKNNLHVQQPMGTDFEQLTFIMYDAIIMELMKKLHENNISMSKRHANLE